MTNPGTGSSYACEPLKVTRRIEPIPEIQSLSHSSWECKYRVVCTQVVGHIKGKSAIYIARTYGGRERNFRGESFWARGYYVSTVEKDEATVRAYIKNQEAEDRRVDQRQLFT